MAVNIVHEATTQRQFVRLKVPITLEVDGKGYKALDWSVAGAAIEGVDPLPQVGARKTIILHFQFESFVFEINVEAEVKRTDPANGAVGFMFTDVTPESLSLLQYLVGAYLTGEVVTTGDVLAITRRENFSPMRSKAAGDGRLALFPLLQRFALLAILWSIGLGLVAFIGVSAFTRTFVVKADGVLSSPDAQILRATETGTVLSIDARPGAKVTPNLAVASMQTVDNQVKTILANCGCIVGEAVVAPGAFVSRGAPLMNLVPTNGRLSGEFIVPLEQAGRVRSGDRAMVEFYGGNQRAVGRVQRVLLPSFNEINAYARVSQGLVQLTAVVRVQFDERLPVAFVGQPATVRINTARIPRNG